MILYISAFISKQIATTFLFILQVAPAELEALLLTHPGVADSGVIGLPDEECGELPHAWVVRKPNMAVTERQIIDFVNSKYLLNILWRFIIFSLPYINHLLLGKFL